MNKHKFLIANLAVAKFMSQLSPTEPTMNDFRDELIYIVDFVDSDTPPFLQTSFLRYRDLLMLLLDVEEYSTEVSILENMNEDDLLDSSNYMFLFGLTVFIKEKDIVY